MKLLRKYAVMDEADEWGERYTLVNDKGAIIAKYTNNVIVFPDATLAEPPFRRIVEDLIKLGYHLFNDDVNEWENSIEESYFMQFEWKELELPKPEYVNILHIGWMLMDSSSSGFFCACQNPKKFDIILKSAVPFLCPLCKKKRERWFGIDSYLEDFLIKNGISLDSKQMRKWINDLMQFDEEFVKDSFIRFLNRTHFDLGKVRKTAALVRAAISEEEVEKIMKLFEKDSQKAKNPV
jgi:hypothetical protein